MNYNETSEHLLTQQAESDDCVIAECPVHCPLLAADQSPPHPMLGPPGQHEVSSHHRDPHQAQAQQQRVNPEACDAEILEEVPLPL